MFCLDDVRTNDLLALFCQESSSENGWLGTCVIRSHWINSIIDGRKGKVNKYTQTLRRNEIVLYVLPRGLEVLIKVMLKHKWMIKIPHFDLVLFSCIMATLHYFYQ